jgi:hypothetical protein
VYKDASDLEVFGYPKYKFISKYAPYPSQWPWYARLNINTPPASKNKSPEPPDKRGTFINDIFIGFYDEDLTFKKDELMLFFMAKVASAAASTSFSVLSDDKRHYKHDYYIRKNNNIEKEKIETFNFTDYAVGNYEDQWEFDFKSNKLISFDSKSEEVFNTHTTQNIENAFIELKDKIEEFQNTRSAYEILDATIEGENTYGYDMHPFAHNEIMFYEIEKVMTGLFVQKTVQRYFIAPPPPSEKKAGLIEFIDTQLKLDPGLGPGYQYNVYAYVLVVGNKYQYANIQTRGFTKYIQKAGEVSETPSVQGNSGQATDPDGGNGGTSIPPNTAEISIDVEHHYIDVEKSDGLIEPIADMFVLNRPNIELLKVPYTKFQTLYIANKPPLHPNVVIYPYKNVNNKLLFALSQFVGEKEEVPIEILPGDKDIFIKAAMAQKKADADDFELPDTLVFKSDEPDVQYQVFRLEQHPSSWSEFATALRKPVLLPDGNRRELGPLENEFVDDLVPNKKYYYMFRSLDPRGQISNPSPIYEVELIDDSGAIYLITKIVTFKHKVPKEPTKSMRKYVHIVPTLKQSNLRAPSAESVYAAEGISQDIHFGDLFGTTVEPRRFKIRFTSKSSGKKFDLNLKFVHTHKGISFADIKQMDDELLDKVGDILKNLGGLGGLF